MNKKIPLTTIQLTLCALFTALIAVLAQVAVPLPFSPVPFTGQVIGIMITGALLTRKTALMAVAAYLLIGMAGMPVFSLARGGIYMLTGPTGGYLIGFIPAVMIITRLLENIEQPSLPRLVIAMLAGLISIYLVGALQLGLLMQYSIKQVLLVGVLPFIAFDLMKIVISAILSREIKKNLRANRLDRILK
jgi:biotin transport system substrate-specific component